MAEDEEKKKSLEYTRGYRDALEDVWEDVLKMATKGYSSQELQIVSKSKAYSSKKKIDEEIAVLEAEVKQPDIIDADARGASPEASVSGEPVIVPAGEPVVVPASGPASVPPPMPSEITPTIVKDLVPGLSYLVNEPKPSRCFDIFVRELASGRKGLCVIRMPPTQIRDNYDIGESQVIWLTKSEKHQVNMGPAALGLPDVGPQPGDDDEYMPPSKLPMLFSMIANFLDGHGGSVVLLEGIEYLISHNGFKSSLGFIQSVNEHVAPSGGNLILPVNQNALASLEYSQLEREMSDTL